MAAGVHCLLSGVCFLSLSLSLSRAQLGLPEHGAAVRRLIPPLPRLPWTSSLKFDLSRLPFFWFVGGTGGKRGRTREEEVPLASPSGVHWSVYVSTDAYIS